MTIESLTRILLVDEGMKLSPYKDSLGFYTIGVGRFIGESLHSFRISPEVALQMLNEDISKAISDLRKIFTSDVISSWTPARRDAIISLIFNMGLGNENKGFLSFKNTIQSIRQGNWESAAENLLNSKWASQVDPKERKGLGRDDRIAYMIRTGNYHGDYKI